MNYNQGVVTLFFTFEIFNRKMILWICFLNLVPLREIHLTRVRILNKLLFISYKFVKRF